jgi:DNA polymerase-3 subunit alpha
MHEPVQNAVPDNQLLPEADGEWEEEQRLQAEKETLGLYLTGHPIQRFEAELQHLVSGRIAELSADAGVPATAGGRRRGQRKVVAAGLVIEARHRNTPRGRMGSVVLDDRSGRIEVTLFSEQYEEFRDQLSVDKVLVVSGGLSFDEYRGAYSIRADRVFELEQARETYAERLALCLDRRHVRGGDVELLQRLRETLEPFRGGRCGVLLEYRKSDAACRLRLGEEWRLRPSDALLKRLRDFLGAEAVKVIYGRAVPEAAEGQAAAG